MAAHRAARPPALGSRPDSDDLPSPPLAASIRQNIPFPASPPGHPGTCEHWHDNTDQSPIRPSSTTAATTPLSSPARSSRRSSQNHPPLQPRRRQIPIDGRVLTAFLRVPSSEAFERRPLNPRRSLTLGRHPKPYPIAAVPCYAIGAAGSNKSPSLAAALGRTIASSSRSQRGTRLLGPTCGAHFLEKAEGALNQYPVFLPVVAPAKAPVGQQCLRQLGPRLDCV